ncbi:hypothetical protein [Salinicola salarius]|uniref:hypothetical protein n=1 Tax=Salinicola salarius TaxID=430457 RepID=UPI0013009372|nr:hypothetical protein [Salinicola salarius]
MQLKIPSAFLIFCGSYLPLSVILLIKDFDESALGDNVCWGYFSGVESCYLPFYNPGFGFGIVAFCLACLFLSLFLLSRIRCKYEIKLLEIKHVPMDLMNYVLPYLVAFISINYSEPKEFLGYLIFLAWLFWITFKSGRAVLNPVLAIFNWKFYEVSYVLKEGGLEKSGVMLSNLEVVSGKWISHNKIQDVIIVRRKQ